MKKNKQICKGDEFDKHPCKNHAICKGLCDTHYSRLKRNGHTRTIRFESLGNDIERFWDKIRKTDTCWFWEGGTRPNNKGVLYGRHHVQKRCVGAHRFSYELHKGKIPKSLYVCHSCDNPLCVNPSHLWVGTHKDNMKDMREKNRSYKSYGTFHHLAKLKAEDIGLIRKDERSLTAIAKDYNVGYQAIGRIKKGISYIWN